MQINTYLNFGGNCEEAFKFYEHCLNGKIEAMITHEAVPINPDGPNPPQEWRNKILHARLVIGNSVLMASDVPVDRFQLPRSFSVNIQVENVSEAERIFAALSENGRTIMPLEQTFWALRFGMCFDRFNISWMINCNPAGSPDAS